MMPPQLGSVIDRPTPRSRNAASAAITTATPRSAIENIAGRTLGSTSRVMMRQFLAPWARAAVTNSRSDHTNVLARVMRPSTGTEMTASAMTRIHRSGTRPRSTAVSDSARTRAGIASMMSRNATMTVSILPR